MKTAIIIPARLSSTRLPRKPLKDICGKTMIQRVFEAASKAELVSGVYVAGDSEELLDVCRKFTDNVIMTDPAHESGTDRLGEAVRDIDCDSVINVQGDEPLIEPRLIDELAAILQSGKVPMVSAMHPIRAVSELLSPNAVKVVTDKDMNALYFSRSAIPYCRDREDIMLDGKGDIAEEYSCYRHIGIYGYKKDFLIKYSQMPQTPLEKAEKLEQLRVLENGYKINMVLTDYTPVGVDTQEDLEKVRRIFEINEK